MLVNDITNFSQIFSKEKLNIIPKLIFDIRVFTIIIILSYLLAYKLTSYAAGFQSIKHKSRIEILFLSAFFILIVVPSLKINNDIYDKLENRKLNEYRPFITKNEINYNFGKDFNNWYSDRFLGRNELIHLYNKLKLLLTNYIYEQDGYYYNKKSHWSFSTGEILTKDIKNNFPIYKTNIQKLNEFCDKNGIKLYIVISPIKGEVYPDKIYPYKQKINNYKDFEQYINKSFNRKLVTYPLTEIKEASKLEYTFPKGDVHWSEHGALIAYKALMQNIKQDFPNINILNENDFIVTKNKKAITDFPGTHYHKGHNYNVMRISIKHHNDFYLSYESKFKNKISRINNMQTFASDSFYQYGNPLKAYIIGNSFSENLYIFLKYTFKETKKRRINNSVEPSEFKITRWESEILKFKPDILIIVIQSLCLDHFKQLYSEEE